MAALLQYDNKGATRTGRRPPRARRPSRGCRTPTWRRRELPPGRLMLGGELGGGSRGCHVGACRPLSLLVRGTGTPAAQPDGGARRAAGAAGAGGRAAQPGGRRGAGGRGAGRAATGARWTPELRNSEPSPTPLCTLAPSTPCTGPLPLVLATSPSSCRLMHRCTVRLVSWCTTRQPRPCTDRVGVP